jgi:hypothetical protein
VVLFLIESPWSPVKRLLKKLRQKYCEILRYKCYYSRQRIYIILLWPSLLFLFLTTQQKTNIIKLHRDSYLYVSVHLVKLALTYRNERNATDRNHQKIVVVRKALRSTEML